MDNQILSRALKDGVGPSRGKSRPFFSTNSFTPNILLWSEDVPKKVGASWCGHQLGLRFLEFDLSMSGTVFQVKHAPPPHPRVWQVELMGEPTGEFSVVSVGTCLSHVPLSLTPSCGLQRNCRGTARGRPVIGHLTHYFPGATLQVRSVRAAFCPGSGLGDAAGGWDGGRGRGGDSPWVEN